MTRGLTSAGSTKRWRRLRLAVLERDRWRCQVPVDAAGRIDPAGEPCGLPAETVDHILPRARGGADDLGNLRAACAPHNRRKGAQLDVDAGQLPAPPAKRRGTYRRPPAASRPWDW